MPTPPCQSHAVAHAMAYAMACHGVCHGMPWQALRPPTLSYTLLHPPWHAMACLWHAMSCAIACHGIYHGMPWHMPWHAMAYAMAPFLASDWHNHGILPWFIEVTSSERMVCSKVDGEGGGTGWMGECRDPPPLESLGSPPHFIQ